MAGELEDILAQVDAPRRRVVDHQALRREWPREARLPARQWKD